MILHEIVQNIIRNKEKESEYFDLKQEWHKSNSDLLHDILCLSNAKIDRDRYIIIGISNDFKVIGLENTENRKNQEQLIDFLNKVRLNYKIPLKVENIFFEGKEIDFIVISNSSYKPFYLYEEYQDKKKLVRNGNIYTRTRGNNTPINETARDFELEEMFKERLGFHLAPHEKFKLLIRNIDDWDGKLEGSGDCMYYKYDPNYRIETSEYEKCTKPESYSAFFTGWDENYVGKAYFKYGSVNLMVESNYESYKHNYIEYYIADGMRVFFPVPNHKYVRYDDRHKFFYYYYNFENLQGKLFNFLHPNGLSDRSSIIVPFLTFNDKIEQENFESYLIKNKEVLSTKKPKFIFMRKESYPDCYEQAQNQSRIYQVYEDWKKSL